MPGAEAGQPARTRSGMKSDKPSRTANYRTAPIMHQDHRASAFAAPHSMAIISQFLRFLVRQPGNHRVDDEQQQQNPEPKEKVAKRSGNPFPAKPFITDAKIIQTPFSDE